MNTFPADPLPWVTDNLRRAHAFDLDTEEVYDYRSQSYSDRSRPSDESGAGLLDSLTNTVTALHDDSKPYQVITSKDAATAGTLMEKRIVEIGTKPWHDEDLTEGQRAAVMVGLVLHEVGHIRHGRGWQGALTRHFGKGNVTPAIALLSNLAADHHDETRVAGEFPGLAPALAVTLWWVGDKGKQKGTPDLSTVQTRINAAISATRYADNYDWSSPEAKAWLEWWADWAIEARDAHQPRKHAEVVEAAIRKCRDVAKDEQPDDAGDEPGESNEQGESNDSQAGQSSADDTPPEQGASDDADEADESGEQGDGTGNGSEAGDDEPEQGSEPEQDDDAITGQQGSTGDPLDTAQPDEYKVNPEQACSTEQSRDYTKDARLQKYAERGWKGQREGLRIRTYKHAASQFSTYGDGRRKVTSVPWKGGRWGRVNA